MLVAVPTNAIAVPPATAMSWSRFSSMASRAVGASTGGAEVRVVDVVGLRRPGSAANAVPSTARVQPATAAVRTQASGAASKAVDQRCTRCIAYRPRLTFAAIWPAMSAAGVPARL